MADKLFMKDVSIYHFVIELCIPANIFLYNKTTFKIYSECMYSN